MSRASHVLSSISNNVGFVLAPAISDVVMKHIQFVRLGDRRVLVVLVGESGIVQNRVIQVDEDMSQQDLDFTSRYMMGNFAGLTLPQIRRQLVSLMQEEKALYDKLLQKALKLGKAGCSEDEGEGDVFVEGTARLMRNPEFADVKNMIEIFEMFEQKSHLVKIITECIRSDGAGPRVTLGLDRAPAGAGGFAMVASPYMYKNQFVGSLGVLGPMRMEYARAIPLVDYVAKVFEGILNRN
jgi:heat-inducible transcriptional repressor